MSYQGSYGTSTLLYWLFATTVDGVPTVFAGSPALSVYKNSLTQSTTGVTLTVSYDGVVGMNQCKIDTSADTTFYDTGSQFSVVISAGTVGGSSVVGRPVGSFSIEAESIDNVVGSVTGGIGGNVGGNVEGNITGTGGIMSGSPRVLHPGNRV